MKNSNNQESNYNSYICPNLLILYFKQMDRNLDGKPSCTGLLNNMGFNGSIINKDSITLPLNTTLYVMEMNLDPPISAEKLECLK